MAADVRDLEALREWLAALATYRADANEALTALRVDIGRGVEWVHEQYHLWQRSIRKFDDAVVQAKADLSAKKFPDVNGRMPDTTVEERNLKRAVARLEHAQEQVETCRKWMTTLPKLVDEIFHGPAQRLANLLDADVPRGAAVLDRRIEALERYAELRTDYSASGTLAPPPPETVGRGRTAPEGGVRPDSESVGPRGPDGPTRPDLHRAEPPAEPSA